MIVSDITDKNGTRCVCVSGGTVNNEFFCEDVITIKDLNKYKCVRSFYSLKIYIDNILHLEIRMENHDGIQSWYEDSGKKMFCIEFYRKVGASILLEYDEKDKWETILKLIDKNI